mgnify:CR=1 FL=1
MPPRQRRAAESLARAERPADDRLLAVQCANGHHVAGVFTTAEGAVVQAAAGRHSHGHRDRVDTPHGSQSSAPWTDFLDAGGLADDTLPAWCECGPWSLSRNAMTSWIKAGERRVVLESKA